MEPEKVREEFYLKYMRRNKDIYKKLVTLTTRKVLDNMEKDTEFIGSAEPYLSSLLSFITLLAEPKKILEIGTLIGYSTLIMADALSQNNNPNSKIFSVDPEISKTRIARKYFARAGLERYVEFIEGKSLDPDVIKLLDYEKPFDLLFIDSLHNYRQTKNEIDVLIDLVGPDGVVICHDSGLLAQEFDTEKQGGVRKALVEFTKNKKNYIFLDPPNWAPVGCFILMKQIPNCSSND